MTANAVATPLLQLSGLVKRFGALLATDNLTLSVQQGDIHAVIGPNGAGKTTLITQLLGNLRPDSGSIIFDGCDITALPAPVRSRQGIARSFQLTALFPTLTALQNVMLSVQAHQGHSYRFWRPANEDKSLIAPAEEILKRVGLGGHMHIAANSLSHGQQRRLDIAMAIATSPKLLLLDEPLAGMGAGEAAQMVAFIESIRGQYTIFLVEHDMDAVFSLANKISVLDCGRCLVTGLPDDIKRHPEVRRAYLGDSHVN